MKAHRRPACYRLVELVVPGGSLRDSGCCAEILAICTCSTRPAGIERFSRATAYWPLGPQAFDYTLGPTSLGLDTLERLERH